MRDASKAKTDAKNCIIPLHIYPFDVMLSVGETDEELFARLDKYSISDEDKEKAKYEDIGVARFCLFGTGQSLIRIKVKPMSPQNFGSLQHEIFHCATAILWRIGMKLKMKTSDEAYAYLIGYLTEEVYKLLR